MDIEKRLRSIEKEYDFPKPLQYDQYHESSRNRDIVRAFFRYSPIDNNKSEKFGFGIATSNNNTVDDIKLREIHNSFNQLENVWKNAFNFIYWQGVPYAINKEDSVFTVKCQLCHSARSISKPGDFKHRQDLYMIYLLNEIEHNCSDGWKANGVNKDLHVDEGAPFPRI